MPEPTRVVSIYRDAYDVYIGRAGKGQDGTFGNPFKPGARGRRTALQQFDAYLHARVADPAFRAAVLALRGKVLGCFCAPAGGLTASDPLICHGQLIARWLDNQPE